MNYIVNTPLYHKDIGLCTQITNDQDGYLHQHEYYEIFYILNGEITHSCNNISEHLFLGDFIILRPKDFHQFIRTPNVKCSHRDILVADNLFEQIISFLNPKFLESIKNANSPFKTKITISKLQNFETILNSFNTMSESNNDSSKKAKYALTNIMSDILFNLDKQSVHNKIPPLVKNIISLLNTKDGISQGIPSVVARYNYSPIYLSRIFKKYLGITMTEYINNVRLNYAELYLQTTSLTLEEITENIGLLSTSYFNKIFKKKHGITPNKYRTIYNENVNAK